MSTPRLRMEGITKRFGNREVLHGIDLDVYPGEFVTLVGPSGCGKTTLLRILAGALEPDGGRVWLDGRDITRLPAHQRNMGMVFQSFALFPHLTVAQNIEFPLKIRRVDPAQRARRVQEALAMVGLTEWARAYPRQLSGGQQQRVGLARAMVYEPRVLLFDEPLSNLDAKLREELRHEIAHLVRQREITAVYVTHDQQEALALSDRVAVMRDGAIRQLGSPQAIYYDPRDRFVATFIGNFNALEVEVDGDGRAHLPGGGGSLDSPLLRGSRGIQVLYIHPQHLRLMPAGPEAAANYLAGRVVEAAFVGARMEFLVELGREDSGAVVKVHQVLENGAPQVPVAVGTPVWVYFDPGGWRRLEEDGPPPLDRPPGQEGAVAEEGERERQAGGA